ncbi:PLP-dependent aminotransferase family protein [Paraglaciecola sp. L3A3]|uniref:aminotransferase-like domain-containing protein n=1 Tax=Paraglaciecola sp. L3A3 TaxID=2686358 RepID=UPI001E5C0269|nr:PLP-dependent aminotransferase family protein [Paraglaciecola sp. L3A3]
MKKYHYEIITERLERKIIEKIWIAGEKLPSIQKLSEQYQISKNTVIHALHDLEASGRIEARPKTGYFVTNLFEPKKPTKLSPPTLAPMAVSLPNLFNDIMQRGAAFDILPNSLNTSPSNHIVTLNRHLNKAQRSHIQRKVMHYDSPLGSKDLRFQIKEHYRSVGLNLAAEDYCITAGCQNALFLALMASCQPGDNVAVESPAFYGVLQLLEQLQLNVIEITSSSAEGFNTQKLEKALEKWQISACVVTPSFATPSGANMTEESKRQLVELANHYDMTIIEDDIYGDLYFAERPVPLKAFDSEERVILCSSFSKSLSRDLRLGWVAGGRWHKKISRLKLVTQLACNQSIQQGLHTFMAEGFYRRHLYFYRQVLKRQREQLIMCIQKHWPESIRFNIPQGGLAIWVQIDQQMDIAQFYQIALNQGIVLTPGALFSASGYYKNYLRLSFAHPTIDNREAAIRKLGRMLWT